MCSCHVRDIVYLQERGPRFTEHHVCAYNFLHCVITIIGMVRLWTQVRGGNAACKVITPTNALLTLRMVGSQPSLLSVAKSAYQWQVRKHDVMELLQPTQHGLLTRKAGAMQVTGISRIRISNLRRKSILPEVSHLDNQCCQSAFVTA